MAPIALAVTLSDLDGHLGPLLHTKLLTLNVTFAVRNISNSYTSGNIACISCLVFARE